MCATCGCDGAAFDGSIEPGHGHGGHGHPHEPGHRHASHDHPHGEPHRHPHHEHDHGAHRPARGGDAHHGPPHGDPDRSHNRFVRARVRTTGREAATAYRGDRRALEIDLLAANNRIAARNRARLERDEVLALNLIGSPGSGKTTLLEALLRELHDLPVSVLEGDQATELDAERIRATGARSIQINTGTGCHLDARMVGWGIDALDLPPRSILFVENVGNLVCPALFDLGERYKAVVLSITEGEEKPLKYPHVFRAADLLLLTKIDLLLHLSFDLNRLLDNVRRIRPGMKVFPLSARTGEGIGNLCGWIRLELAP